MRKLLSLLTLAGLLLVAGPAQAAPANVTIGAKAELGAGHITVPISATCEGGTGTVTMRVAQRSIGGGGIGTQPVVCDGAPHDSQVNVVGPFVPGEGLAQAVLSAPGGGDTDSRTITIA